VSSEYIFINPRSVNRCCPTKRDIYLSEKFVHLATKAIFCFAMLAVMFIAQEVVPEEWVMNQAL